MSQLKALTSRSYHDYLINSLKNPESAAGYIEVMLELDTEDREPELLRESIKDVITAYAQMNILSKKAEILAEKLDQILIDNKGEEIFMLIELLDALGFRVAVIPKAITE